MTYASFLLAAVTVFNAGFEESGKGNCPAGWSGPKAYRIAPGEGRNGSSALRYDLAAKGAFLPQTAQEVKLEGGKAYRISAWVKTKDVKIEKGERAAAVGLEYWDAKGKCRGSYSKHVLGTEDWQEISIETPRLVDDLKRARVQVYCGYGKTTGTAWFDDVQIEECVPPPIEGFVVGAYRGVAAEGTVRFSAAINCPSKELSLYAAELRYVDADGKAQVASPSRQLTGTEAHFELPVRQFKPGEQEVELVLRERAGKVLGTMKRSFRRVASLPKRRVSIDGLNRTLVDGKPFFPLGMYCGVAEEKEMAVYREGPFNCLMPYTEPTREQLDGLQAKGLMVIYPLKEVFAGRSWAKARGILTEQDEVAYITKRVNEVKDHPAVLAWYLNDELGVDMTERLARHQRLFESLDDQHPTWTCLYQVGQLRRYLETYDALGTDPYPVQRDSLSRAADWTLLTRDAAFALRPVWQVPQAFSWSWFRSGKTGDRMPTEAEMRSMTWQMLAGGANGLVFYAFHQMRKNAGERFPEYWTWVKNVATEVKRFEHVFLAGDEPPPFVRPAEHSENNLPVRLFRDGTSVYALVANATAEPVSADIRIRGAFKRAETLFGAPSALAGSDTLHVEIPAWGETLARVE